MLIRRRERAKEVICGVSVKVSKVWRKIQRVEWKCMCIHICIYIKKTYCSEKKVQQMRDIAFSFCYFVLCYFTLVQELWGVFFVFLAPVQQPLVQAHCRAVCNPTEISKFIHVSDMDHSSYRIQALVCKYFKICCLYTFVQYLTQSCWNWEDLTVGKGKFSKN